MPHHDYGICNRGRCCLLRLEEHAAHLPEQRLWFQQIRVRAKTPAAFSQACNIFKRQAVAVAFVCYFIQFGRFHKIIFNQLIIKKRRSFFKVLTH